MKRRLLALGLALGLLGSQSAFANEIQEVDTSGDMLVATGGVLLDGTAIELTIAPVVTQGRTLVPLRSIFEAFGASVEWVQETLSVISVLGDTEITLSIGSDTMYINGEAVTLDVPAQVLEGNTMVPVRAIAEAFGAQVEWDSEQMAVVITRNLPGVMRVEIPSYEADTTSKTTLATNMTYSTSINRWATVLGDNIFYQDGNLVIASAGATQLSITTHDYATGEVLDYKALDYELPLFGGIHQTQDYYYVMYGQTDQEEQNLEVYRLVRYDHDFNRVDSMSLYSEETFTTVPFDAGSLRMADYGDELVIHTARERYLTDDGYNHQSQMTFVVDTKKMETTNELGRFQTNHVSHSFDQFVAYDGGSYVFVDHGDAYPRSIVVTIEKGKEYDVLEIPGTIGANMTGTTVASFEISEDNYLVGANRIDYDLAIEFTSYSITGLGDYQQRDTVLLVTDKSKGKTTEVVLASYSDTEALSGSAPRLVDLGDDTYLAMWLYYDLTEGTWRYTTSGVQYVVVDGDGKMLTEVMSMDAVLPDAVTPIYADGSVVWYGDWQENDQYVRAIYSIDVGELDF